MIKRVLTSACLASAMAITAAPPYPGVVQYRQPDGSTVAVTIQGNSEHHVYFNNQGDAMLPDSTGMLHPIGNEMLRSTLQAMGGVQLKGLGQHSKYVPTTGSPRVCVILVQFADVKFSVANPREYFNNWLNQEGFSSDDAIGSVKDYFKAQSSGKFIPQFDVYGPVTLKSNRSVYSATKNAYKMVHEAAGSLDSEINFGDYDLDSNGDVDNVYIIYAGQGANHGAANAPWPHNSNCPTGLFTRKKVDGKTLNHYACASEQGSSTGRPDGIGTFVHEFGHVLGLSDLYNTSSSNEKTPNWWSVMDVGSYLGDSRHPCNYSSYERRACDWLDYTPLTGPCNVNLRPMAQHNFSCVIETGRDRDFYLLEHRPATGWDRSLPGEGMLIWHIDGNDTSKLCDNPNNDSNHLLVDLVRADNSTGMSNYDDLGGDPWPGNKGKTEFTSTTTPAMVRWNSSSSSATTPVDKPVTEIAKPKSELVTFKFMGGSQSNVIDPAPEPEPERYTVTVEALPAEGGSVHIGYGSTATSFTGGEKESVPLCAEANEGYKFKEWQLNGETVAYTSTKTITLKANTAGTYYALFEAVPKQYTVTVEALPAEGGSVHIGYGSTATSFTGGEKESVPLCAEANEGYKFKEWQLNGETVARTATKTITLKANTAGTYYALFELLTNSIDTVGEDDGESVSVECNGLTIKVKSEYATPVEVYSAAGVLICATNCEGTATLTVAEAGVYVVKAGNKTVKLIAK